MWFHVTFFIVHMYIFLWIVISHMYLRFHVYWNKYFFYSLREFIRYARYEHLTITFYNATRKILSRKLEGWRMWSGATATWLLGKHLHECRYIYAQFEKKLYNTKEEIDNYQMGKSNMHSFFFSFWHLSCIVCTCIGRGISWFIGEGD